MIKGIINRFKNKPTLFLVLAPLVFIWGIPTLYHYIGLPGGESLAAIFPMGVMFFATIALFIDFGLVSINRIKLLWISVIEAGLLGLLFITHLYLNRTVSINVQDSKHPYLIILDKPTGIKSRDLERTGLFDKEYRVINKDLIYMDLASVSNFPVNVICNGNNGLTIKFGTKPTYAFKWAFYEFQEYRLEHSDKSIDSLIKLHLKPGERLYDEVSALPIDSLAL